MVLYCTILYCILQINTFVVRSISVDLGTISAERHELGSCLQQNNIFRDMAQNFAGRWKPSSIITNVVSNFTKTSRRSITEVAAVLVVIVDITAASSLSSSSSSSRSVALSVSEYERAVNRAMMHRCHAHGYVRHLDWQCVAVVQSSVVMRFQLYSAAAQQQGVNTFLYHY